MQGVHYAFLYEPIKVSDHCEYSLDLQEQLNSNVSSPKQRVIIGGYFNVTFDSEVYILFGCASNTEGFG